jgi:SPOR domain
MADHRKTFRPRRLAFDGRTLPRGRLLGAALALLGALTAANISVSDRAHAQEAGLKSGVASLTAGNYDAAVRQLSATVNNENSTPGQAAKALYLRGIAYRKLGQEGRAIADLGAALWLGLPTSDRVRALVNKGLAYKSAGLSSQGDAAIAQARSASSSSTVDKIIAEDGGGAVASNFDTQVSSGGGESSSPSSSSGESVWSRLVPSFGGSSSTPPPAPAAEPAPAPAATQTAAAPPPTAGWGATVADEKSTQSSGSGVSRWFGSLTGDSAPAAPSPGPAATTTAPPRTTTAERTTSAPKAAPPPASSWAANTETTKVASETTSGGGLGRWFGGSSEPAPAATPQASGPGYRVQLANSRSEAEAQALWKQVTKSNRQLASAAPQIEKVDIGSFGTFYSLKIGPFASQADGTKVCNALKRSGTDCSVVSPDGP